MPRIHFCDFQQLQRFWIHKVWEIYYSMYILPLLVRRQTLFSSLSIIFDYIITCIYQYVNKYVQIQNLKILVSGMPILMSHGMRKPVFAICEQQRCWSDCADAPNEASIGPVVSEEKTFEYVDTHTQSRTTETYLYY